MEKGWQRQRQVATLLYGKMFLAGLAPNAKQKTGLYHNKIILCFRLLACVFSVIIITTLYKAKIVTKNRYPVQSVKD